MQVARDSGLNFGKKTSLIQNLRGDSFSASGDAAVFWLGKLSLHCEILAGWYHIISGLLGQIPKSHGVFWCFFWVMKFATTNVYIYI